MDIGTGKDLNEYTVNNKRIPYHLIDICEPGEKFLLPDFQREFYKAFEKIIKNNSTPILCGGTGLYIDAILNNYAFTQIPENLNLRSETKNLSHDDLKELYFHLPEINRYTPDLSTKKRTIRAIEINNHLKKNVLKFKRKTELKPIIFGINIDRTLRRQKITERLKERLSNGLIAEVENLINTGISPEVLKYYGLEYKFVTEHLEGLLSKKELFIKLETAIHQYAKRQMTWFRKMERSGKKINWLDTESTEAQNLELINNLI